LRSITPAFEVRRPHRRRVAPTGVNGWKITGRWYNYTISVRS
jgi:hypothetical protein